MKDQVGMLNIRRLLEDYSHKKNKKKQEEGKRVGKHNIFFPSRQKNKKIIKNIQFYTKIHTKHRVVRCTFDEYSK